MTVDPFVQAGQVNSQVDPFVAAGLSQSAVHGLTPDASVALQQAEDELKKAGISYSITSSFRSAAEQAHLYAHRASNPNPVAKPGTSMHEKGLAIDLVFGGGKSDVGKQILSKYGFVQNVKNDPVHYAFLGGSAPSSDAFITAGNAPDPFVQAGSPTQPIDVKKIVEEAKNRVGSIFTGASTSIGALRQKAADIANQVGIPPDVFGALIETESNWAPGAKGKPTKSGIALGLGQLMPGTAKSLGVNNPLDPEQNLRGAATYFKHLMDRYNGDVNKALYAYNWGPGNVDKGGSIPASVQKYAQGILARAPSYAGNKSQTPPTPYSYQQEASRAGFNPIKQVAAGWHGLEHLGSAIAGGFNTYIGRGLGQLQVENVVDAMRNAERPYRTPGGQTEFQLLSEIPAYFGRRISDFNPVAGNLGVQPIGKSITPGSTLAQITQAAKQGYQSKTPILPNALLQTAEYNLQGSNLPPLAQAAIKAGAYTADVFGPESLMMPQNLALMAGFTGGGKALKGIGGLTGKVLDKTPVGAIFNNWKEVRSAVSQSDIAASRQLALHNHRADYMLGKMRTATIEVAQADPEFASMAKQWHNEQQTLGRVPYGVRGWTLKTKAPGPIQGLAAQLAYTRFTNPLLRDTIPGIIQQLAYKYKVPIERIDAYAKDLEDNMLILTGTLSKGSKNLPKDFYFQPNNLKKLAASYLEGLMERATSPASKTPGIAPIGETVFSTLTENLAKTLPKNRVLKDYEFVPTDVMFGPLSGKNIPKRAYNLLMDSYDTLIAGKPSPESVNLFNLFDYWFPIFESALGFTRGGFLGLGKGFLIGKANTKVLPYVANGTINMIERLALAGESLIAHGGNIDDVLKEVANTLPEMKRYLRGIDSTKAFPAETLPLIRDPVFLNPSNNFGEWIRNKGAQEAMGINTKKVGKLHQLSWRGYDQLIQMATYKALLPKIGPEAALAEVQQTFANIPNPVRLNSLLSKKLGWLLSFHGKTIGHALRIGYQHPEEIGFATGRSAVDINQFRQSQYPDRKR